MGSKSARYISTAIRKRSAISQDIYKVATGTELGLEKHMLMALQVITFLRETARISYGSLRTLNSTVVRGPTMHTSARDITDSP